MEVASFNSPQPYYSERLVCPPAPCWRKPCVGFDGKDGIVPQFFPSNTWSIHSSKESKVADLAQRINSRPATEFTLKSRLSDPEEVPPRKISIENIQALPFLTFEDDESTPEPTKNQAEKMPRPSSDPIINLRAPCQARGMPKAHNYKTAYFTIPSDIKHGEELMCSFPCCSSAGAKFRYCSHCKVPVAKRNFRNRHKHGGQKKSGVKHEHPSRGIAHSERRRVAAESTIMECYA